MSQPHPELSVPSHGYRPDIDGLRAVAVLMVLIFHLFPGALPAGFVGVDIFFVISGFLIGGIVIRERDQGTFSLLTFYERRAVRILPSLLTVCAATWFFGWLILFGDEYRSLGWDLVAAALFVSNFRAWAGTGYFAPDADTQPLLHLWSLGIEEQFYLLAPLAMALVPRRFLQRWILAMLGASFVLGWWATGTYPSVAFYWPFTRAWELLAGVALAVHSTGDRSGTTSRERLRSISSHLGFLLLGACFLWIRPGTGFPGWRVLLPVLAAVGILHGGAESWLNRRLLSWRPVRWIGLISYPLYLWHWPLLVYWSLAYPMNAGSLTVRWSILLGSVALATLTVMLVEGPIRRSSAPLSFRAIRLMGGWACLVLMGGLILGGWLPERLSTSSHLLADAWAAVAERGLFFPFRDNHLLAEGFEVNEAPSLDTNVPVVLFAGDSHMEHYWSRIEYAAGKMGTNALRWRFAVAGGVIPIPGVDRSDPKYHNEEFFRFVEAEAFRPEVSRVVLSCFWSTHVVGFHPGWKTGTIHRSDDPAKALIGIKEWPAILIPFQEFLQRLRAQGKDVVVILPGPASDRLDPRKLSRLDPPKDPVAAMSVSRVELTDRMVPVRAALLEAARQAGARTIDPFEFFADGETVSAIGPDGVLRYADNNHLRPGYVRSNATFIDALLLPLEPVRVRTNP
jgi:peptidoglycan/LPS O-acetylase OafA/YrhL